MAQLSLDKKVVLESLGLTLNDLLADISWVRDQTTSMILLDVPDPYNHAVESGPLNRACHTVWDECTGIGVFMAVDLRRTKPSKRAATKARVKARRRS